MDEAAVSSDYVEEEPVEPEPTWAQRLPLVGRIFSRRAELDPEVKALLEDMSRKTHEEEWSHLVDEGRLLLSIDADRRAALYAVPTTTGQVGVYFVEGATLELGGGHLVRTLPDGIDWQIHYRRDSLGHTRWFAFGLLANDVERVELKFADASVAAQMGANSFFFEDEGDPSRLIAFALHLRDRSVRRLTTKPA